MLQSKSQEEPAPVEAQPHADMAFVLSAPEATLAPDKLTLTGVSSTAQFITDDHKSGFVRTGAHRHDCSHSDKCYCLCFLLAIPLL